MTVKKPTYQQLEQRIKWLEKEILAIPNKDKVNAMALMLDLAPNSITVHDQKGRILYANKKSFELHGYSESEFMSLSLQELDIPECADLISVRMQYVEKNGVACFEVAHYRKDRSVLPLEVYVAKVNWYGIPAILSIATNISERKKTEEALLLSEEKFQKAFKYSSVLMAISTLKEGTYIDVNEAFLSHLEFSREAVIGRSSKELNIFVDESQRESIIRNFKDSSYARNIEVKVRSNSGKILIGLFSIDIITLRQENFLLTQMIDITEQKRTTTALIASELKFRNIFNASPMGMHLYQLMENGELIFIEANTAADKILGVNHNQFKGKTIEEAFPGLTGTEVPARYRETALNGTVWQTEQVDYHEGLINGAFEVFAFQIEQGKMVTLFNEITQRKRTQEELLRAKEKAEESDRLKTAFLQNMSHEIRTPMNAITGFAYLLENPELTQAKRNNFTSIIIHSSNQLLSIVNDILTISAIDTHQERVTIERVCVNQVIYDLYTIFKDRADSKNIGISKEHPLSDKESEIYTDLTKLTQILTNLLTNALKFTQEGIIRLGYHRKGDELEFYIKDNGIGIKAEVHDKIFERFRQADMLINKKYGGTGLGLAISKAFTELLGGRIWVESEIGKGSTFFFTIPYKPVTPEKKARPPKKIKTKKTTVLIVDDEETNLFYLKELLQDLNIELLLAKDGKEAVGLCRSNPSIALVLMDIRMPIMDGQLAASEIKKSLPALPIIAQSAYALDREIKEYKKYGFDDYITKPILRDELLEKILKFIT
jgi:PAS domain S-box-containing protein